MDLNVLSKKSITEYTVQDLLSLLEEQERWVDDKCVDVCANTTIISEACRRMLGSTLATRVAEGEVDKKYYQTATKYLNEFERVVVEGLKYLFRAEVC